VLELCKLERNFAHDVYWSVDFFGQSNRVFIFGKLRFRIEVDFQLFPISLETCSAMDMEEVKPGDSIPIKFTNPGNPF
jgi:hypothetical protein